MIGRLLVMITKILLTTYSACTQGILYEFQILINTIRYLTDKMKRTMKYTPNLINLFPVHLHKSLIKNQAVR